MRAMAIDAFGGPETLRLVDLPRPLPRRDQLLIRIVAAGVSRLDCRLRAGQAQPPTDPSFPLVPGCEVAGVVEELGESVGRFRKGDRVWSFLPGHGGYAEYVAVEEEAVALMPTKLLFEEAAAFPLCALAAQQALFERAPIDGDSTVLIHDAAGGVGHFAVQLAAEAGATVHGTARSEDHGFLNELGAGSCIDPSLQTFVEPALALAPQGYDLVLDTVGGNVRESSYAVLKTGGRLVSLVDPGADDSPRAEVTSHYLQARPDAMRLGTMAKQIDLKRFRTHVQKIYGLGDAADAHRALEGEHVRGRLVLNL